MVSVRGRVLPLLMLSACLPGNPSSADETGSSTATADDTATTGAGGMLGCAAGQTCTLVLVSQTLDDRVEVFAPDDPDGNVYRGSIDLDFKPNGADGNNQGELLDEPFDLAIAGGHLHVLVGHYPLQARGSLVSFPLSFFGDTELPAAISRESIFNNNAFVEPVTSTDFDELEPIFGLPYQGRFLVGVFNNDLFSLESSWTAPGRLLVVDAESPSSFAAASLENLEGGSCNGVGQLVDVGDGVIAAACDGNEAVAFLMVDGLGDGDVEAGASSITGTLCDLPPLDDRRARYLAPDGRGGVAVAVGPGFGITDPSEIYVVGPDCSFRNIVSLSDTGQYRLAQIVRLPTGGWLFASGAAMREDGKRGVYGLRDDGTLCDAPVGGFDNAWSTPEDPVDPYALALSSDGTKLVVGAAPFAPARANDPGYGKVLWAELAGTDPCELTASVTDLTDGSSSSAAAPTPGEPSTWRRGPNVVVMQEVQG